MWILFKKDAGCGLHGAGQWWLFYFQIFILQFFPQLS